MGRIAEYFGFGDRQAVEDRALTRENVPASMLTSAPGDPAINVATALGIGDVFACVRLLAESAAILPIHTYRKVGERRERTDGATAQLLDAPAPATTTSDLIGQIVSHLACHGSAFVGKYKRSGEVTQLGLLDPARMAVEVKAGRPVYTYHRADGQPLTLTTRDVVHIRTALSLDGITGLSPIRQARVSLGLAKSLAEHGQAVMSNGGMPGGVLRVGKFGMPSPGVAHGEEGAPDDLSQLRDAWRGEHGGTSNAGKVAVLSGEVEWTPLSLPLEDLLFVDQRKLSATECARLFRIPAHLISAESGNSMSYSNTESDGINFIRFTLQPYLTAIEKSLSRDEDLFARRDYCQFNVDALMRADSRTRAEVHRLSLDPAQGWQTRAEVRALEDLPPEAEPAPAEQTARPGESERPGRPRAVEPVPVAANGNRPQSREW